MEVTDCGILRLGNLEFDFVGTCGTFIIKNKPIILLCFYSGGNGHQCRTLGADFYSSSQTEFIVDSTEDHIGSTIANYKGYPLAMGGERNTKLEMFDFSRSRWVQKASYPFTPQLHSYSIVSMPTSVIYFGGRYKNNGWTNNNIVAEFKDDFKDEFKDDWIPIGKMTQPRDYHRSIQMNDKIFVFGGSLKYDYFNY